MVHLIRNAQPICRHFWKAIAEYNGPDPLETWHRRAHDNSEPMTAKFLDQKHQLLHRRFIKWTQETFHTGGHQAELLSLLERCTRSLQSHEQYKNDIRYLRIWIQYVRSLLFFLLHAQDDAKCLVVRRLTAWQSPRTCSSISRYPYSFLLSVHAGYNIHIKVSLNRPGARHWSRLCTLLYCLCRLPRAARQLLQGRGRLSERTRQVCGRIASA